MYDYKESMDLPQRKVLLRKTRKICFCGPNIALMTTLTLILPL